MILPLLQITAVSGRSYLSGPLENWSASPQCTIVGFPAGATSSDWSARELSEHFLWEEGVDATPDDAWRRMDGAKGLWVIYQNARVMLEMADYAAQHSDNVDRVVLETLRSDAMQIRLCVMMALAQYAIQPCQRRCPRQRIPRCFDVYRDGGPDDSAHPGTCGSHSSDFVAAM